jgi:NADPH:quinone reductase-like Zn-dependent oxidoreductase
MELKSGKIQPGHRVLINSATGVVGAMAVQIAKALGGEVAGACSTKNVNLAKSLGAEHISTIWARTT